MTEMTISKRMVAAPKSAKGEPRKAWTYRSARRNAVRAEIRRAAAAKRAGPFPGWGAVEPRLDAMVAAVDTLRKRVGMLMEVDK